MASSRSPFLSSEQYLELDSRAELPSEYYDGVMYPIEATTFRHGDIQMNTSRVVQLALLDSPCRAKGPTIRVKLPNQRYAYPDLFVVCGKIEREDKKYDTALNPVVIFEVLSPSTGDFDRGGKADSYRAMPSVREYVIIAQESLFLQRYSRQDAGKWLLETFDSIDAILRLESIGIEVPLSEIYRGVEFDSAE